MTELLTAAQMRAIENAAIESGEVTGLELMERAGRGVVEAILEEWPEMARTSQKAVVLCGPGNNGGDGFVVARLLKARGWEVEVFLYGEVEKLPPDAKVNAERWLEVGEVKDVFDTEKVHPISGNNKKTRRWSKRAFETWVDGILVDSVFGIGLSRPIDERFREVFLGISQFATVKSVAIDVPSGLDSDTGKIVDFSVQELRGMWSAIPFTPIGADLTVTFHKKKVCHVEGRGPFYCGKTIVKDIGLEKWNFSLDDTL